MKFSSHFNDGGIFGTYISKLSRVTTFVASRFAQLSQFAPLTWQATIFQITIEVAITAIIAILDEAVYLAIQERECPAAVGDLARFLQLYKDQHHVLMRPPSFADLRAAKPLETTALL